jgi:disulfide bond formation protein DsbB
MMKKLISVRQGYMLGFFIILLLEGFVYFLQSEGISPCPLCLLQRWMMGALCALFFVGMLFHFKKTGNKVIGIIGILITLTGMLLAGRQTWLQHIPPIGNGGCGVSLQYLVSVLPFFDVLKLVWQGGTECSETGWVFLHLSLAEWSLILFGIFFIFVILQLKRSLKR